MKTLEHPALNEIKQELETNFYLDLNIQDYWDNLLEKRRSLDFSLQEKIEAFASIGRQNIKEFFHYSLNFFDEQRELFFLCSQEELEFSRNYLAVLSLMVNVNERLTLEPFLTKDITYSASLITQKGPEASNASKHKCLQKIIEKIATIIDKNQLFFANSPKNSTLEVIKEILFFPFFVTGASELINQIEEQELQTKFAWTIKTLIQSQEPKPTLPKAIKAEQNSVLFLSWEPEVKESFVKLKEKMCSHQNVEQPKMLFLHILPIINLFLFLKKIYFSTHSPKHYGYYQRLVDKVSGDVLYSIPYKNKIRLFLGSSALIAAETNIRALECYLDSFIILSFNKGLYLSDDVNRRNALNTALLIDECLAEYLFLANPYAKAYFPLLNKRLLLEMPHDNPLFVENIYKQLCFLNADYASAIQLIPSLKGLSEDEKKRYLREIDTKISVDQKKRILIKIKEEWGKESFHLTEKAFTYVKIIQLKAGEKLFSEDDAALFIYIPLEEGLKGKNKAFQYEFLPKPWSPLGHIGVIQQTQRTATIIAEKAVKLIMIPAFIYTSFWHIFYCEEDFSKLIIDQDNMT